MWNSAPANPYTTVYPGGYVQPQSYIGMPSAQTLPHQMPPQMSQQMSQPSGQEDLFLIVNPSSGGNKGQDFMKVPQPFIMDVDGVQVNLHIHSIKEEKSREAGFAALKQALYYRPGGVRVVVGGGDGTVMWVDSEMEKHGIDSARQVIYGIVPLGTGNDFARSYGWGGKNPSGITENDCAVLRDLVRAWVRAKPVRHDVWEVEVNVHQPEDGDTDEEDGGPRRGKVLKVEEGENGREEKEQVPHIKKPLVNYFSIGQESRMGIDFDKNRTKSQSANLCVYGIMSLKTECSCFQKWSHIGSVVGSLHAGADSSAPVIFNQDKNDDEPDLVNNPECLMFLNINSYGGGTADFWHLENDIGVEPVPAAKNIDVEQDSGDGKLEVVSVPNLVEIAVDSMLHKSNRIWSGGPYFIQFSDDDDTPEQLEAWLEVDGEFYHVVNPSTATVRLKKTMRVLRKVKD